MRMRISLVILLFTLIPFFGFSSTVRCSNPEYSGKKLVFFKLADPISGEKELAFTLQFNAEGKCTANITNKTTIYAFCDFGIYHGMLLIEPNKTIELKLPPFREKSFANQKNPYFSPIDFWFISEDKNQVTNKLSEFDQQLSALTNKYFNELYFQQSKTVFDSVLVQLELDFPETTPASFELHKKLKIQFIKSDIFRLRPEEYSVVFEDIKPVYWIHETFVALFEKTFDNQLSFSAKAIGGKKISEAVHKEDIKTLLKFVQTKYKVSGKMSELVLLKMLHDGFYSGYFSQAAIKKIVAASTFAKNNNAEIKLAAENILAKFSFLQKGSVAPKICLNDLKGQFQCTNQDETKFKYIVFADAETIVCQEHLKYLSRINELFSKYLDIFVVLNDTDKKGIETFFTENQLPSVQLIDLENKYISEFKVRSFPMCLLLNEKHQMVFTNTSAPLDGFEQQFGTYLRNELFMRQRNQSR